MGVLRIRPQQLMRALQRGTAARGWQRRTARCRHAAQSGSLG
ncbi:integrase, catalytic region [Xanthomonas axonopodis Xac29-1]|nr:integrase, catalytic region [Xanthomonas axonopodis Xac29-1]